MPWHANAGSSLVVHPRRCSCAASPAKIGVPDAEQLPDVFSMLVRTGAVTDR